MSDMFADPDVMAQAPQKLPPHRFCWRPKLDKAKTAEAGRNVYEDAPWIDVQIDSQSAISHHATPEELQRFRASYEQFLRDNSSEGIIGTRLEEWAPMSRSMVEEYRYLKIRTVEDLANIADARLPSLPQGREWHERAKAWLQAATEAAPLARVEDENRKLRERLDELEKQNKQVMRELDKATAPKKG